MTDAHQPPIPCPECGSPLRSDQRYCLQCGARHGAPRVDHLREMGVQELPREVVPAAPRGGAPIGWRRRAPWAAGAAAIAGGVLLGWLTGPAQVASSAPVASRIVLLEAAATAAPAPTPSPTPEPTPTPTATATPEPTDTPEPTATATRTPKPKATAAPDDEAPLAASTPTPTAAPEPAPAIKHVWLVRVAALPSDLAAQGTQLTGFDDVALLSGQDASGAPFAAEVLTLPGQLAAAGLTWKAYVPDPAQGCPAPLNAFHSLDAACAPVALSALATDPPNAFAYVVTPDDATLRALLASPAYADGGLAVLEDVDGGALLLSPLAKAVTATAPYALLRTLEDAFGLAHLGHAADALPTPTPTP